MGGMIYLNKLNMSPEKVNEYIEKCKRQIGMETEVKEAIERRGEIHPGELKLTLENIKNYKEMLKILEDNKY